MTDRATTGGTMTDRATTSGTMTLVHLAFTLVALVASATLITMLARRTPIPAPLWLLTVGAVGSYLPALAPVPLPAEVVLVGLLPPLLYAAAIRTSVPDLRANRSAIGFLAIGLVIATAAAVGFAVSVLLHVPFPVGFAIGAVVAPPDAVAATAIGRRIGLPRRVVTVLEGESLLNDASALVALRTAIAAMAGGVTAWQVFTDFSVAVLGGTVIGLAVGWLVSRLRRHLLDPVIDTALSFLVPFVAFLPAEAVHASGVLAVVVAGLFLGHQAPLVQTAASRVTERTSWATIQFVLEHVVFLMIGLQARQIITAVSDSSLGWARILLVCGVVCAVVVLVRPLIVGLARSALLRGRRGGRSDWAETLVISWAGMRGVVTLAAAFTLPSTTPYRDVLIQVALAVTALTLLLQGLSLPWLANRLGVVGPDPREDALQLAAVLQRTAAVGLTAMEQAAGPHNADTVERIRTLANARVNSAWERLGRPDTDQETPSHTYRRLRLHMLRAERAEALRLRDAGQVEHEVLEEAFAAFDAEEATLERVSQDTDAVREAPLRTPAGLVASCDHLQAAPTVVTPTSTQCLDCIRDGTLSVHLRLCLSCGYVGCCDSSPGQHARQHAHDHDHPVIRSFEPGEHWRWCFIDEALG